MTSTAKEELAKFIQNQPDSSREEIIRELAFHLMVQRGLAKFPEKNDVTLSLLPFQIWYAGR